MTAELFLGLVGSRSKVFLSLFTFLLGPVSSFSMDTLELELMSFVAPCFTLPVEKKEQIK